MIGKMERIKMEMKNDIGSKQETLGCRAPSFSRIYRNIKFEERALGKRNILHP